MAFVVSCCLSVYLPYDALIFPECLQLAPFPSLKHQYKESLFLEGKILNILRLTGNPNLFCGTAFALCNPSTEIPFDAHQKNLRGNWYTTHLQGSLLDVNTFDPFKLKYVCSMCTTQFEGDAFYGHPKANQRKKSRGISSHFLRSN